MNKKTILSLIIPVYNEEKRIIKGLNSILFYLKKQKYTWEIIVVDDGSSDRTIDIIKSIIRKEKRVTVIKSKHLGKGGAIKKGVVKAIGKWLVFLDIDLATPIEELEIIMPQRFENPIIIGSRKMKGAQVIKHQPVFREFAGKVFTILTNLIATRNISDVTCGFKFFKADVAKKLFNKTRLSDWSFDAEILFLAQKYGYAIKEVPVRWSDDPHTKVNMYRDTIRAFLGLLKIRTNDILGCYSN